MPTAADGDEDAASRRTPEPLPPARVAADDDRAALRHLAARRWRVGVALTAAMMIAYFGFILLIAFAKPTAGTLIAGGRSSVGIAIGAAVIVLAPVLTGLYVRWANRRYDAALAALRSRMGGR